MSSRKRNSGYEKTVYHTKYRKNKVPKYSLCVVKVLNTTTYLKKIVDQCQPLHITNNTVTLLDLAPNTLSVVWDFVIARFPNYTVV